MNNLETYPLGQMEANCYVVHRGGVAVIIDPADESDFISQKILEFNLKPAAIIATHGHFDHILAAGELQMIFNIPFYICQKDEFLLNRTGDSAKFWLNQKRQFVLPRQIENLRDGGILKFGDMNFKVAETPGHTPGSVCLILKNSDSSVIFSGDLLFKNGIGRYDFSYSNEADIKQSLKTILKLPPKTVVYPGHGPATTIRNETGRRVI